MRTSESAQSDQAPSAFAATFPGGAGLLFFVHSSICPGGTANMDGVADRQPLRRENATAAASNALRRPFIC
eukprot:SAG31_NODE_2467_length_5652_cov_3.221862_7_plen_71_part_00